MDSAQGPRLGPENPWPGLGAFGEEDRDYFHGRDAETAELARLVRREPLTVLFGRSGLGKTSLLGAGLVPRLREDSYFSVLIRLSYSTTTPLSAQVQDAVLAACAASAVEGPPPLPNATLWQFFQRAGVAFWNARNRPVIPVLVLDQFEEIFTLGQEDEESRRRSEGFLEELGDLIENRPPPTVRRALDADPEAISGYDFQRRGCKVVLSFREDFLAQMEGLKRSIPSLMRNRYRLQPMNGTQAYEVVTGSGGHLVSDDVARSIVGLAWRNVADPPPRPDEYAGMEVDPALLSVICSELNLKRQRAGRDRITADLLAGAEHEILTDFYERAFSGLDPRLRAFVEDELITDRGYRDSFALEDALQLPGVSREAVDRLVAGRLLRVDERFGVRRLELTHDVLTRVVKESRDSRKAREAEAAALARERAAAEQQRKYHRNAVLVGIGSILAILLMGLAGWYWYRADKLLEEAKATDLIINARSVREDKLDLALLLGAQATRMYPDRVDGQVDLMGLLLANSQLRVLFRAEAKPQSYAFRPDGKVLAVGTNDGTVSLWSTDTWRTIARLKAGAGAVTAIAFSRDGSRLAAAGLRFIALWRRPDVDSSQGGPVARKYGYLGLRSRPVRLVFSPDGAAVAVQDGVGTVGLWKVGAPAAEPTWQTVHPHAYRADQQEPSCLAFAADGGVLTAVAPSGDVVRWDVAAGQRLPSGAKLDGALGVSPDCELAARRNTSQSGADTIQVVQVDGGTVLANIAQQRVAKVRFASNGRVIALAEWGEKGRVHVYDARAGSASSDRTSIAAGGRIDALSFSPDGKTLAIALEDGTLIARELKPGPKLGRIMLDAKTLGRAGDVIFSPDSMMLMALPRNRGGDEPSAVWTLERRGVLTEADGTPHVSGEVEFNYSGDILASSSMIGSRANFWSFADRAFLKPIVGFSQAEFSPDGDRLAIARGDGAVEIRDKSGKSVENSLLPLAKKGVGSLAFSWDDHALAIGFDDGAVAIYDLTTNPPTSVLQPTLQHGSGETWVAFSPDGKTLASAGHDNKVVFWKAADGWRPMTTVSKNEHGRVLRLAFSPDGKLLASAYDHAKVVLYEVDTGKESAELAPDDETIATVDSLVFIEDGKALVLGGAKEGPRKVWDVAARRWRTTLRSPEGAYGSLALSPKGRRIALRHDDGQVTLLDWKRETLKNEACRIANRNLTCVEWRQYVKEKRYRKTCAKLPPPTDPEECG